MEQRDLIVTPLLIIILYAVAFIVRPLVTDDVNRKYFLPAFTVRIIGALALGFIYQFYYHGGDTFNYHTHGSRHVWEAFMDSPSKGVDMLLSAGKHQGSFYKYSSRIYFFGDPPGYFVIRIAAVLDLLTFSTYSATAVLFGVFSFIGAWMFFLTFDRKYPDLHKWLAVAILFIPSVFFWGSGLLKDTIVLSCLGIVTFELDRLFFQRKISLIHILLLLISLYFIFSIKKFVLQAYLPAAILWIYVDNIKRIKSMVLKIMILPFILVGGGFMAYYSVIKVGEGDRRYSVDKLAETARITAMDIRYQTGKDAGSGYTLGDLDGSFSSMVKLAPNAINVSLFRPYLWEVNNPLMLISSLESTTLLLLTLYVIFKWRTRIFMCFSNPDFIFCLTFSIAFAFAVGVSTFNFGTLVRYKIPQLPFYSISLLLIVHSNSDKKLDSLETTE